MLPSVLAQAEKVASSGNAKKRAGFFMIRLTPGKA
jgi:hypothetical protein